MYTKRKETTMCMSRNNTQNNKKKTQNTQNREESKIYKTRKITKT
jgi:hypothetical protein